MMWRTQIKCKVVTKLTGLLTFAANVCVIRHKTVNRDLLKKMPAIKYDIFRKGGYSQP
jgi:hypothetical protein